MRRSSMAFQSNGSGCIYNHFWRGFGLPGGLTPGSFESAPPWKGQARIRRTAVRPICSCWRGPAFGLLPVFFAFFTGLAFFRGRALNLGQRRSGWCVLLRLNRVGAHAFLLDRAAVVTIHRSECEKQQGNS